MLKRQHAYAALAGLLVLGLGGPAVAQTTVTMWSFLDPTKTSPRERALRTMIEQFEAANPGIRVVVEPQVFSELGVKFLLGHNMRNAPDVVFVNTENMGAIIESGAAADLQALFIDAWPEGADDDFYVRAGWDAALVDGQRFMVPLFHASTSIFYRRDLLEAAGIDPDTLTTWEAFNEAARALTTDTDGDGVVDIWGFATPLSPERTGGTTAFHSMITGYEGAAWDGATCEPNYVSEGGIATMQMHVDWINTYGVMSRDSLINNTDDLVEQFAAGRHAMVVAPFARYSVVEEMATWDPDSLAILPWPNWTDERPGPQIVQGWWAAAWADSPQLEAAGRWLEYMISPEAVRLWSVEGGQVPTRMSVFEEPVFSEPEFDYMRALVEAWAANSFMIPISCNMTRFDADLNTAAGAAVLGQSSIEDALARAERQFLERQQ